MTNEVLHPQHDRSPEVELSPELSQERERLREDVERAAERGAERNIESSRHETELSREAALETATPAEETAVNMAPAHTELERGPISRSARQQAFRHTMNTVRAEMSAPSRLFSKLIHTKPVERVSEVTGASVARPNAILAGAVAALVVTTGVYIITKAYGYPLSGFESIGAFAIGWLIGLLYDYLRVLITGKTA